MYFQQCKLKSIINLTGQKMETCFWSVNTVTSIKYYEFTKRYHFLRMEKKDVKTSEIVQRYLEYSENTIYRWLDWFKIGRTSLENESISGRLNTAVNDTIITAIGKLLVTDRRIVTIREISTVVGIEHSTCMRVCTIV